MPGNSLAPPVSLATFPIPADNSHFDIIVVGAGVLGSAFASTFGKQGKKVLLIERDLSEPDRIVGELLQPGGYKALKELGLADCLEDIDAIPAFGYGVLRGDEHVHIPYLIDPETGKQFQGRSFHHGRFINKLRQAAARAPNVTIVEATVNETILDEEYRIKVVGVTCTHKKKAAVPSTFVNPSTELFSPAGVTTRSSTRASSATLSTSSSSSSLSSSTSTVATSTTSSSSAPTLSDTKASDSTTSTYYASLTVIADGCFSKFRKQFIEKPVATTSHFVGFIIKDIVLPFPQHGHVILANPSPILMYQVSARDTRILVDIPGKLPSASTGALRSYLENIVYPQLPSTVQGQFMKALETERLRSMPNSFLPPSTSDQLGVIVLGDAMNMRHPLTGGGMTVALNDVVFLKELLEGDTIRSAEEVVVQMEVFFWKRKQLSSVINVLAQALYALFSGGDENLIVLRNACFSYFQMGGECINGPVGLLSGITRRRTTLIYHFYAVALHGIWLMFHQATWAQVPATFFQAFSVLWTACVVLLPVLWSECKA